MRQELCGRLELNAAQIKRFKGFVCWHHLVPTSEGGDNSSINVRPFIYSQHVILHIVPATFWPNKLNLQCTVEMMTGKNIRGKFPEGLLVGMDAAVACSRAAESSRLRALAATGDHPFQDRTKCSHATAHLPRCSKCSCQHRVDADRPNHERALKKETRCDKGESKHQSALDLNNRYLPFCTLGKSSGYWNCWCSHLCDGIPWRGHINVNTYAARKA